MISKSAVFRNVIVYITISSRSFVFNQSRVEVSTSLFNEGLAVGAFDSSQSEQLIIRKSSTDFSLRIQPPLIRPRYYVRNAKRDVYDSRPKIPY